MSDYTRLVEVLSLNNKLAAENEALQKRYLSDLDLFGKCQEREQQLQSEVNNARKLIAKLHTKGQCTGTVVNTSALSELRALFKSEDESPVVLPERLQTEGLKYGWQIRDAEQWNACIDEFERLNK